LNALFHCIAEKMSNLSICSSRKQRKGTTFWDKSFIYLQAHKRMNCQVRERREGGREIVNEELCCGNVCEN